MFLRLLYLLNCALPSCRCRVWKVRLIQWAQAIWVCGNVQFSGSALSGTQTLKNNNDINTASTKKGTLATSLLLQVVAAEADDQRRFS